MSFRYQLISKLRLPQRIQIADTHPAMRDKVIESVARIKAVGRPVGLLSSDPVLQNMALESGIDFLAVGVDAGILARQSEALLERTRGLLR